MATTDEAMTQPARTLAGATVMQIVASLKDDAVARGALDVAAGLLRSGARAQVAGASGRLVGELQSLGGEWIDLELSGRTWRRRRQARQLHPVLLSEHVDLVHAHGPDASRMAFAAARSTRTRLLTSYFGLPPERSWRRSPEDGQARGHLVTAVSEFAALAIAERYGIPPDRTVVIPAPVETGWFDPHAVEPERVAALRETWRIRPEVRVVLAPGKLVSSQGHMTLVDAARSLVNGGLRGVVFVIAGDQPEEPDYAAQLTERIEAQGLRPLFRQVGTCPDMRTAYAAADLVALPVERPIAFSTMAAEAQAMARPVVAANIGAMPEMLQAPPAGINAPRTGWMAPPGDALALARCIADALALAPRAFDRVGDQARQWAQRSFSPERVAAATLATYLSMLQER